MRSASSPPTVGSTTISNSVVITSMPTSIARLAVPPSARGTMLPKLRLQPDSSLLILPSRVRYWQLDDARSQVRARERPTSSLTRRLTSLPDPISSASRRTRNQFQHRPVARRQMIMCPFAPRLSNPCASISAAGRQPYPGARRQTIHRSSSITCRSVSELTLPKAHPCSTAKRDLDETDRRQ